jgi:hypothetical protein
MFRLLTPSSLAKALLLPMDYDNANVHTISLAIISFDALRRFKCVLMFFFMFCNTSSLCFAALETTK